MKKKQNKNFEIIEIDIDTIIEINITLEQNFNMDNMAVNSNLLLFESL